MFSKVRARDADTGADAKNSGITVYVVHRATIVCKHSLQLLKPSSNEHFYELPITGHFVDVHDLKAELRLNWGFGARTSTNDQL